MNPQSSTADVPRIALWMVLLAGAATFALTICLRQTMGLFLSPLNTAVQPVR